MWRSRGVPPAAETTKSSPGCVKLKRVNRISVPFGDQLAA
jgi:hypothetical protein